MRWPVVMGGIAAAAAVWMALPRSIAPPNGPEPITLGRDACDRCRMVISQPGFGGELRDRRGLLTRYDDLGCLLQAMWAAGDEPAGAWASVQDGGRLVPLRTAHLVRGDALGTPMGYGVVAFGDAAAARAFAQRTRSAPVTLEALRLERAHLSPRPRAPAAASARAGGRRPVTDADALAGRALYVRECSACHGERGDGQGPAAPFLDPRPRDFTKAQFKLRSTESGQPPTTADLLRTLERGMAGSAMPSFAFLPEDERRQLVAYVLSLADLLDAPEPVALPAPGAAPPSTPETVARGQTLYATLRCGSCHGPGGRGDGPSARALRDDEGRPIPVRDFTGGLFRGGARPEELYARFVTGMDGSPMPSFASAVEGADRWALVHYVLSLRQPAAPRPLPTDPLRAGRLVAARHDCRGCHVLDDGKGGDVGPDLRVSGQKLDSGWVARFLHDPRAAGRIYPFRPYRMPHVALSGEEIDVLARYLAAMGHRRPGPVVAPEPARFSPERLAEGKSFYVLRCAECHALGQVIQTPLAKQQGPDLIRVAGRVDYEWARRWIEDPKRIDPRSRMTIPGITPAQVDSVRMFVWKASLDAAPGQARAP